MNSDIEKALLLSENIFKKIKEFKIEIMRKFLKIDYRANIIEVYKSGFKLSPWDVKPLRELIVTGGCTEGPSDTSFYESFYADEGFPLITPEHIQSLRFSKEPARFIRRDAISDFSDYDVLGGDIILQQKDDAGASALVPIMHEASLLGTNLVRIRFNESCCEIFYALNILHFYYNTGVLEYCAGKNSGSIPLHLLLDMPVPLPSQEMQKNAADTMLNLSGGMVAQENYSAEMGLLKKLIKNIG